MCGIIGVAGVTDAAADLIEGLQRLEYRGYDSAGLAVATAEGALVVRKAAGVVARLAALDQPLGRAGVGHTRWATHGPPSERNAHPHLSCDGRVAVVHNGIIENHQELREKLEANGHRFASDTDSEVIAHLVEEHHAGDLVAAVRNAVASLEGSYALAVVASDAPDRLVAARHKSPLIVGRAEGYGVVASDASAILPHTRTVGYLDDHDLAEVRGEVITVFGADGAPRELEFRELSWSVESTNKKGFEHFMLKEIHEIPAALAATLEGRLALVGERFDVEGSLPEDVLRDAPRIVIVACGTSHYAGLVAKTALERLTGVAVEVHVASEFRYAPEIRRDGALAIFVSQSGETADTLEALRKARSLGCTTLAFVNVAGSTLAREADATFYLRAGPEIGVASTKAFVNMLGGFYLLGLHVGRLRGTLDEVEAQALIDELAELPGVAERALAREEDVAFVSREVFDGVSDAFFLGRQLTHGLAMEAALKLKEISYIHAEGYAAGELKHGPLALLEPGVPVTALVPCDEPTYAVMLSNIVEARARGAHILGVLMDGDNRAVSCVDSVIRVPRTHPLYYPVPAAVALYLLSYHAALARGCPIDKPRNLAKSVTVE